MRRRSRRKRAEEPTKAELCPEWPITCACSPEALRVGRKQKRVLNCRYDRLLPSGAGQALPRTTNVRPLSMMKSGSAIFEVEFLPANPSLQNYTTLFAEQPFARNILNSLIVASLVRQATAVYGRIASA